MFRFVLAFVFSLSFLYGAPYEGCLRYAIPIERAIEIAKRHVGKPYKVWIGMSKRTGECFWKVKGTEGYLILQASSGEVIRFYRNRR